MNERLCIEEVGLNLEFCVHAHGHDVDLIMEASLKINYLLGISSSYLWDLVLCNRGFDHDCSPLIPYHRKVNALAFCTLIISATSILIFLRVLPSGILRISKHCVASYESLSSIASHRFQIAPGSELLVAREHP